LNTRKIKRAYDPEKVFMTEEEFTAERELIIDKKLEPQKPYCFQIV
jgi:uncharacterized short protein YbdD (DUF466 family)